jgi:hypothetical protein
MLYKCIECKYETNIKNSYNRHVTSAKHIGKDSFTCKYCPMSYAGSVNLAKHSAKCSKRDLFESNLELELKMTKEAMIENNKQNQHGIDALKNINNSLLAELTEYRQKRQQHRQEVDTLKNINNSLIKELTEYRQKYQQELKLQIATSAKLLDKSEDRNYKSENRVDKLIENSGTLVNNSLNTINRTVNALTYINKNFGDAPVIQPLLSYDMFKKPKDGQLVEELIHYHKQKMLAGYIGDVYIKAYAKDNPQDQGIWNTDNARLTYYVRVMLDKTKTPLKFPPVSTIDKTDTNSLVGTNKNNPEWVTDKKGLLVSEYTLKPILEFLSSEINKYIQVKSKYILKYPKKNNGVIMNNLTLCGDISISIDNGKLKTDILKYIAPNFDLSRAKKTSKLLKHSSMEEDEQAQEEDYDEDQEEQDEQVQEEDNDDEEQEDDDESEMSDNLSEYEFDKFNERGKKFDIDNFGYHHNLLEPEDKY